MAYSTQYIGLNLSNTTPDATAGYSVGTRTLATDGSEWMYVKAAGAATTAYSTLWVDQAFNANMITQALAITAGDVAFVASALSCSTSGVYFWAMTRGNPSILVAASVQPAVPLYTSNTAGVLSSATNSASDFQVMGLTLVTSNGGSTSNVAAVASFPLIRRPVA